MIALGKSKSNPMRSAKQRKTQKPAMHTTQESGVKTKII